MHLDDLDVEPRPQGARRVFHERKEHVDTDAHVRREDDRNLLAEVAQRALVVLVQARGADDRAGTVARAGGKMRERARLGVKFTSVVLADGTRLPLQTETIFREGDPPGRESTAKIGGGAIGGAIIGGILGGAKGAAIGGSIGAGAGTAAVMAGDRNQATLSAGTPLTVRLEEPVTVTVER